MDPQIFTEAFILCENLRFFFLRDLLENIID